MPHVGLPLFAEPYTAPYRGSTPQSRSTSASGAVTALTGRSQKIEQLRALWAVPRSMQDVEALSGLPLASVCSLKACLGDELVECGEQQIRWPDGRTTRRTLWKLKSA